MASGIGVNPKALAQYKAELKKDRNLKWMIFSIGTTEIDVEKVGTGSLDEFMNALPKQDCRYGVFDCGQRIQFVFWSPDSAPVKNKLIYATSKDAISKKLEGAATGAIEAHEWEDLEKIRALVK